MVETQFHQTQGRIAGITIIDDDPEERESLRDVFQSEGLKIHLVTTSYGEDFSGLINEIVSVGYPVLCDLRLSVKGPFLTSNGAEVVAHLYDQQFPALLATMFSDIDDVGLHPFLRRVPVVIPKDTLGERSQIEQGVQLCKEEFFGNFATERRPHRSIIQVREILYDQGPTKDPRVLVVIPGWNAKRVVELPWASIPIAIRPKIGPGLRLLADTNIGATRADKLFFENIELAKPARDDDDLA